jgi:hypothetical protein
MAGSLEARVWADPPCNFIPRRRIFMGMKITESRLRTIIREELDYIRYVDRDMPTSWDSLDPQDVHDEFLMWRDANGEVSLEKLASELGVIPSSIDWNGTGLRVLNGMVSELL